VLGDFVEDFDLKGWNRMEFMKPRSISFPLGSLFHMSRLAHLEAALGDQAVRGRFFAIARVEWLADADSNIDKYLLLEFKYR